MPWYEIKVTPTEKKEYVSGGRSLFIWDGRSLAQLETARQSQISLQLDRAAFIRDRGFMEDRGSDHGRARHLARRMGPTRRQGGV